MTFTDDYRDVEQARRFRHRSILFFIILATLPCYIVGAIMLGVAPNDEEAVPTLPPGPSTRFGTTGTVTVTIQGNPSITLIPTTLAPLGSTPGQFRPSNTPFPTQILATLTLAPSITSQPSPTATNPLPPSATATTANQNPIFNIPPENQILAVGENRTVNLSFSDPDNDPISMTANSSNASVASVTGFGATSFTLTGVSAGTTTITITLLDNRGGSTTAMITATVGSPNNNPTFNVEPSNVAVNQGSSVTVDLVFSDPDGDPVTFNAVSASPSVASITPLTSNSFQVNGVSSGSTTITITLSDGRGGSAGRTISATVTGGAPNNNPNFVQEPLPISIAQGDSNIVLLQISDPDGDPITLTVTATNPAIIVVDEQLDNQSFTVQGLAAGTTTVTIKLTDSRGGITQRIVNATVN